LSPEEKEKALAIHNALLYGRKFIEEDKGEGIPNGLLKANFALVLNTSNTPSDREKNVFLISVELKTFIEECLILP
jgi:hypothetical protein